jgi:hypothetical protein
MLQTLGLDFINNPHATTAKLFQNFAVGMFFIDHFPDPVLTLKYLLGEIN